MTHILFALLFYIWVIALSRFTDVSFIVVMISFLLIVGSAVVWMVLDKFFILPQDIWRMFPTHNRKGGVK